jgi:hypothetical protein
MTNEHHDEHGVLPMTPDRRSRGSTGPVEQVLTHPEHAYTQRILAEAVVAK